MARPGQAYEDLPDKLNSLGLPPDLETAGDKVVC